ncbi:DNA polymerase III subunit gamma and tau [Allobranchiibius sp. GilTou73]|uniref:DNA polymerase III subunit gamma and tau n=1 Tax=Allobranchiibius sp. GilTou73 TaxID=2904523 RepID=UPI001F46EB21|nr:DNA polymerase III subunit gamma and tau [Allobranchiibius sp. GilTou73]UIJ35155.1 DNA polymerase III subunit gamma and tau [Allobranchiibius sp. GilTou73]
MSTALYRRYRPETFADVIGQEHVTVPLMRALETGRVNHAYLFSGPRGCGKTTSARILARCLNCEQGPTPTPCGVCDSCVALSRGGAGTVDVIEIDAASHGGVDDARDLRERAAYGPASSRFKVYIIDEAHMVTTQGFNALLKVVEEPPEHVKFVFATTEPEKVIGTIRSRTHHYPFRLVPPQRLTEYMEQLCVAEGVQVEPGVLSFVTRAGGGSVRDSLSVLDQLISGSQDGGLTYAGAAALLGFTDGELLDATIDALAVSDPAATFRQIGRVIESGHDPRRFVEDLLERLRDLIIVAAVPDGVAQVLRGVPEDQLERMREQAAAFGAETLARAATIVNAGLTEMTGATAPRLQLELICARVLLPGASGEEGYAARLDRLERRLAIGAVPGARPTASASDPTTAQPSTPAPEPSNPEVPVPHPPLEQPTPPAGPAEPAPAPAPTPTPEPTPDPEPSPVPDPTTVPHPSPAPDPDMPDEPDEPDEAGAGGEPVDVRSEGRDIPEVADPVGVAPGGAGQGPGGPPSAQQSAVGGGLDTDAIRRAWPDVLNAIARIKRVTWALLSQHAHVLEYDPPQLVLGVSSAGLAQTFERGSHRDVVRQALQEALGVTVTVTARTDSGAPTGTPQPDDLAPARPPAERADPGGQQDAQPAANDTGAETSDPQPAAPVAARRPQRSAPRKRSEPEVEPGGWGASSAPAPSWASEPAAQQPAAGVSATAVPMADEDEGSRDDEDVEDAGEVGIPVVTSILGGVVIEDQRD